VRIPFQINSGGKDVLGVMHIPNRQNDIPVVIIMCYGLQESDNPGKVFYKNRFQQGRHNR